MGKRQFNPVVKGQQALYFIYAPEVKRIKIGLATDIAARMSGLQSSCPCKLYCLHYIFPATVEDEKKFHEHFKLSRQHGEWFALGNTLSDYLGPQLQRFIMSSYELGSWNGPKTLVSTPEPVKDRGLSSSGFFNIPKKERAEGIVHQVDSGGSVVVRKVREPKARGPRDAAEDRSLEEWFSEMQQELAAERAKIVSPSKSSLRQVFERKPEKDIKKDVKKVGVLGSQKSC